MQLYIEVLTALCLLACCCEAQSCVRITASDLGNTNAPSTAGLISERLSLDITGQVQVRLFRFHIVCETTAQVVDRFRRVSLVAEYSANGVTSSAQFEFLCVNPTNVWGLVSSPNADETVTNPPDASFDTPLRRDCIDCLSSRRLGSTGDLVNHCVACPSRCTGLQQCYGLVFIPTCCNYYDRDGRCTESCALPTEVQADGITCGCPPGSTGENCDESINFCSPDPCMNQGTCSSQSTGFTCTCTDDWTGPMCEIQVDPCNAMPCQNGGTCSRLTSGTFQCSCPDGYDGMTCTTNINECNTSPSPCLNGGTCMDTQGSFRCMCRGSWVGPDCGTCNITNCSTCSSDGVRCIACAEGNVINEENTCSFNMPCNSACSENGVCHLGICRCNAGFRGNDCSSVICRDEFCDVCSADNNDICETCQDSYSLTLDGGCEPSGSSQIVLTDIQLVAIIVCSCIAFIVIVVLCMCFLTFVCMSFSKSKPMQYVKGKEVQKRQKHKKHLVKRPKKTPKEVEATTMVNSAAVDMEEQEVNEEEMEGGGDVTLF